MPSKQDKYSDGKTAASKAEEAAVSVWAGRINTAKKDLEKRNKRLPTNRKYLTGEQHSDGSAGLVRANLLLAHIRSLNARTFAKNPEIAIAPSDSVPDDELEAVKLFCTTAETVLDRKLIKDGKLKKRMRGVLRSVRTTGEGWLKIIFHTVTRENPVMIEQYKGLEDNLNKVKKLMEDKRRGQKSQEENEALRYEIEQQMEGIQAQVEMTVFRGIVIDNVLTEDMFILDKGIMNFEYYEDASAMAHRIWMKKTEYEEKFDVIKEDQAGPTLYDEPKKDEEDDEKTRSSSTEIGKAGEKSKTKFVEFFEIWDKSSNRIYSYATGMKSWCKPPFTPEKIGKRFYPFFRLGFNIIDGKTEAVSDVDLGRELQDEYNTTRTNFADHRKAAIPAKIARKGGLQDIDVKNIQKRKISDIVFVEIPGHDPLSNHMFEFHHDRIDPLVYDTSQIRSDMEIVLGQGEANVGTVYKPKTATEAEILNESASTQGSDQLDMIEDYLTEIATYALELLVQELTEEEVKKIAGNRASWPQLSRDAAFDLIQLNIRAGSTTKPNKAKEMERWTQLYPLIKETIIEVEELKLAGKHTAADAMVRLLKETLRRFEERIDIDSYLGKAENQDKQLIQQLEQELMQLKMQLEQMTEQQDKVMNEAAKAKSEGQQMQAEAEKVFAEIKRLQDENGAIKEKKNTELEKQIKELQDLQAGLDKTIADIDNQRKLQKLELENAELKMMDRMRKFAEQMCAMGQPPKDSSELMQNAGAGADGKSVSAENEGREIETPMDKLSNTMAGVIGQMGNLLSQSMAQIMAEIKQSADVQMQTVRELQAQNNQTMDKMVKAVTSPKQVLYDGEGRATGVKTIQ